MANHKSCEKELDKRKSKLKEIDSTKLELKTLLKRISSN